MSTEQKHQLAGATLSHVTSEEIGGVTKVAPRGHYLTLRAPRPPLQKGLTFNPRVKQAREPVKPVAPLIEGV